MQSNYDHGPHVPRLVADCEDGKCLVTDPYEMFQLFNVPLVKEKTIVAAAVAMVQCGGSALSLREFASIPTTTQDGGTITVSQFKAILDFLCRESRMNGSLSHERFSFFHQDFSFVVGFLKHWNVAFHLPNPFNVVDNIADNRDLLERTVQVASEIRRNGRRSNVLPLEGLLPSPNNEHQLLHNLLGSGVLLVPATWGNYEDFSHMGEQNMHPQFENMYSNLTPCIFPGNSGRTVEQRHWLVSAGCMTNALVNFLLQIRGMVENAPRPAHFLCRVSSHKPPVCQHLPQCHGHGVQGNWWGHVELACLMRSKGVLLHANALSGASLAIRRRDTK